MVKNNGQQEVKNHKLNWLDEVRADADFNARRRVREAQEQADFEAYKNNPVEKKVVDENEALREELAENPTVGSTGKPELDEDTRVNEEPTVKRDDNEAPVAPVQQVPVKAPVRRNNKKASK